MNKTLLALFLFSLWTFNLSAQFEEIVITGTVIGENDEPIPGVNIFIKNTTTGTISEFDGSYSIEVPDDTQLMVFSYIGFLTIEEPINNRSIIDIVMIEDTKQLEEIVVTGYSSQKKADVIGSISSGWLVLGCWLIFLSIIPIVMVFIFFGPLIINGPMAINFL